MGLLQGILACLGRVMIATIFLVSAAGNKIWKFNEVAGYMAAEGVPQMPVLGIPLHKLLLTGAIAFLLLGGLSVAVNLSARHLVLPSLVSDVEAVLDEFAIAPQRVVLEITESAVLADTEDTLPLLVQLREMGISPHVVNNPQVVITRPQLLALMDASCRLGPDSIDQARTLAEQEL